LSPRTFAALDLVWPARPEADTLDLAMAWLDGWSPVAVEETDRGIRAYFSTASERDRAVAAIAAPGAPGIDAAVVVSPVDVADEGWAERSQAALTAVRAGRLIVAPPWARPADPAADEVVIVIQPSMGFGTGHHPSTRLCLRILQELRLESASVLDAGTGSGVLAIAAAVLGSRRVIGIDADEDALGSARENIDLNAVAGRVSVRAVDLADAPHTLAERFDVVTANLTGASLVRLREPLAACLAPRGTLIASGFQDDERDAVVNAFAPLRLETERREDGWLGIGFTSIPTTSTGW